ncbi:MAG TPA: hypothetical protein VGM87_05970 [Roseomonas sp.]|jgi:hypothetical protein
MIRRCAAAALLALAACGGSGGQGAVQPASAATASAAAPDVSDVRGMQAIGGGAAALVERGFVSARGRGATRYWWHEGSRRCIQVISTNGRYSAIDPAPAAACGR